MNNTSKINGKFGMSRTLPTCHGFKNSRSFHMWHLQNTLVEGNITGSQLLKRHALRMTGTPRTMIGRSPSTRTNSWCWTGSSRSNRFLRGMIQHTATWALGSTCTAHNMPWSVLRRAIAVLVWTNTHTRLGRTATKTRGTRNVQVGPAAVKCCKFCENKIATFVFHLLCWLTNIAIHRIKPSVHKQAILHGDSISNKKGGMHFPASQAHIKEWQALMTPESGKSMTHLTNSSFYLRKDISSYPTYFASQSNRITKDGRIVYFKDGKLHEWFSYVAKRCSDNYTGSSWKYLNFQVTFYVKYLVESWSNLDLRGRLNNGIELCGVFWRQYLLCG